jgi:hypothetical protein
VLFGLIVPCISRPKSKQVHWLDGEVVLVLGHKGCIASRPRDYPYTISINYLYIRIVPSSLAHNHNLTQYNYITASEYAQHIGPERGITQQSREVIQKRPKLQSLVVVHELVIVLVYSGAGCGQRKLDRFASIPEVFSHPGSYPIGGRISVQFLR